MQAWQRRWAFRPLVADGSPRDPGGHERMVTLLLMNDDPEMLAA